MRSGRRRAGGVVAARRVLVAARLAESCELPLRDTADSYWVAMLRSVGCTGFAHETARTFTPDDREMRATMLDKDLADKRDMLRRVVNSARPHGTRQMVRAVAALPAAAKGGQAISQCDAGVGLARGLGLPAGVVAAMDDIEERWDGKGQTQGKRGAEIARAARVATVAWIAVLAVERGATDCGMAEIARRSGGQLDPDMAATFIARATAIMPGSGSVWDEAVAAEPGGVTYVGSDRIDAIAATMARFVDLLSIYTLDHSTHVAALAEAVAKAAGKDEATVTMARRAGLLHDLGRVAVPAGVWEKPGPLSETEREKVRLHAYVTERLLARSPVFAPLARIAGADHERLDGSGYPKGLAGDQNEWIGRVLAAADVWDALTSSAPIATRSAAPRRSRPSAKRPTRDA